jgi:hypothetical protein
VRGSSLERGAELGNRGMGSFGYSLNRSVREIADRAGNADLPRRPNRVIAKAHALDPAPNYEPSSYRHSGGERNDQPTTGVTGFSS